MIGAAAMSLSSFCVVTNALRLNLFNIHSTKHDKKPKDQVVLPEDISDIDKAETGATQAAGTSALGSGVNASDKAATGAAQASCATASGNDNNFKEENTMKKTINIEGMMCEHCEATVKKALESVEGVKNADVSHVSGTAVVTADESVSDEAMKQAVEAKDYKVVSIE